MTEYVKIDRLVGKTVVRIERGKSGDENDQLVFVCDGGCKLVMTHRQDCCETVEINDIAGDLEDLIGTPILTAEERESEIAPDDVLADRANRSGESYVYIPDSETWTFYTLRTIKGTVDIRWDGSSNGYYSEAVDCIWVEAEAAP